MKDHSRKQTTRLNRRARRIEGRRQKVQGFSLTQHHWHVKVYSSKDRAGMTAKTWLFLSISPGRLDYFFRVFFFFLSDTSMPGCKIKRTTILYRILLSVLQAMWGLLCFDEERQTSWKKQNSISFSLEDFEVSPWTHHVKLHDFIYLFFLIGLPSVVFLLTCSETCLWIFFFLFVWSLKISWMRGGLFILHPLRCCEFSALEKVRRRPMSLRLKFSQLSAVDQPRLSQIAATMTNYYGHFLILALQPSFFFSQTVLLTHTAFYWSVG